MAAALECGLCHHGYTATGDRVPLSLACGHTLCRDCDGQLPARACPWCRKPVPDEAPPNYALVELLTPTPAAALGDAPEGSQPARRKPIGEMTLEELRAFRMEHAETTEEVERAFRKRKREEVESRHDVPLRELHAQCTAVQEEIVSLREEIRQLTQLKSDKLRDCRDLIERGERVEAELRDRRRLLDDELRREGLQTTDEAAADPPPSSRNPRRQGGRRRRRDASDHDTSGDSEYAHDVDNEDDHDDDDDAAEGEEEEEDEDEDDDAWADPPRWGNPMEMYETFGSGPHGPREEYLQGAPHFLPPGLHYHPHRQPSGPRYRTRRPDGR